MLKRRIAKWSLERKRKKSDMLAAIRLASQRQAQGKETIFWIRGRLVTFQDVKHYFRRKGVRDLQALMETADDTAPSTHIDCRTPEPELAIDEDIRDQEVPNDYPGPMDLAVHERFDREEASSAIVAVPVFHQVDPVLSLNATTNNAELLLNVSRAYYDSAFENQDWSMENFSQIRLLERSYHYMLDGYVLLERGDFARAFQHFDPAFDLTRELLKHGVFLFLPYLYHIMLPSRRIQRQEVFSQLLAFAYQMGQTCFPTQHPIQRSITLLQRMSAKERGAALECSLRSIVDRLRMEFGDFMPKDLNRRHGDICFLGDSVSMKILPMGSRCPQTDYHCCPEICY